MYQKTVQPYLGQPFDTVGMFAALRYLDKRQAQGLLAYLGCNLYWVENQPCLEPKNSLENIIHVSRNVISTLREVVARAWFKPETNIRNNVVTRTNAKSFSLFCIENMTSEPDEFLYHEFHRSCITLPQELKIISYSKGNVTVVSCSTISSYEAEIEAIKHLEQVNA
ncbi:hypothetical protein [Vibrio sp. THAF190c]|uniref:hypothetical protein n=1 Tax=Vibrio sp. THAF190c TaxID=2587865 RepID=UPI0012691CDD|nr:hypothetical protein [Vibrio sp. THAF190c]QFT13305.1 hypothetical protein FIV04_25480 [Vibrio sp. THAF190c]